MADPPRPLAGTADARAVSVVIPVKAFDRAKARLAPMLDATARAGLARRMATTVVAAAAPLPAWVVCDDPEVADWAATVGAGVSWQPGRGLNEAVAAAVAERAAEGFHRVVVAHADLPLAHDLVDLVTATGPLDVVLVPDRHDDGTNVLCLPAACGFRFAYGGGSFRRHLAEVDRLGLTAVVRRDADLGWDVDVPADLVAVPDPPA